MICWTSRGPRRCVFAGTVNEGGFLTDLTGNRRFWPLVVKGLVDLEAIRRDRDQLRAEASHMEASGASHILQEDLWPVAAERQAEETTEDPWADIIRHHLRRLATDEQDAMRQSGDWAKSGLYEGTMPPPADRIHTSDLLTVVLRVPADRQSTVQSHKLRAVMENCIGWTYKRALRIGAENRAGYTGERQAPFEEDPQSEE